MEDLNNSKMELVILQTFLLPVFQTLKLKLNHKGSGSQ